MAQGQSREDLQNMGKDQLEQMAREQGMSGVTDKTKNELIDELSKNQGGGQDMGR